MNLKDPITHCVKIAVRDVPCIEGSPSTELFYSDARNQGDCPYHSFRAKHGDTLEWQCDLPFTIDFGWATPFEKATYKSEKGILRLSIPVGAQNGQYKYFIAVWCRDKEMIVTDDPDMIVIPGGGHGP